MARYAKEFHDQRNFDWHISSSIWAHDRQLCLILRLPYRYRQLSPLYSMHLSINMCQLVPACISTPVPEPPPQHRKKALRSPLSAPPLYHVAVASQDNARTNPGCGNISISRAYIHQLYCGLSNSAPAKVLTFLVSPGQSVRLHSSRPFWRGKKLCGSCLGI